MGWWRSKKMRVAAMIMVRMMAAAAGRKRMCQCWKKKGRVSMGFLSGCVIKYNSRSLCLIVKKTAFLMGV